MADLRETLYKHFPALAAIEDPAWRRALESAGETHFAPGSAAFKPGDPCRSFLMVTEGSIRVQMLTEDGKEIVLYRVARGDTCVLTTSCLFGGVSYPAEGVAEGTVRAIVLSLEEFQKALAHSEGFRRFVFSSFGDRLSDLVVLVEEVAFGRVDRRLAQRLLDLADDSALVRLTHQQIAVELGTAREVVSRLLKEFERRAWVALHRGHIELVDRGALERQANIHAV